MHLHHKSHRISATNQADMSPSLPLSHCRDALQGKNQNQTQIMMNPNQIKLNRSRYTRIRQERKNPSPNLHDSSGKRAEKDGPDPARLFHSIRGWRIHGRCMRALMKALTNCP